MSGRRPSVYCACCCALSVLLLAESDTLELAERGDRSSREGAARCVSVESAALAQEQKQSGRSWLGEKAVARCLLSCASA